MDAPQVVSTLPSATEILYALDVPPVGVSHACRYPPAVDGLPVVTHPDNDGRFQLRTDVIENLDPDVIVTQDLCEQCAIDATAVETGLRDQGMTAEIITSHPHRVTDILTEIMNIGQAVNKPERAQSLVTDIRSQFDTVARRSNSENRPDVVVCDWMDPLMVAGHWVPELVETAGGTYPLEDPGNTARPRDWEELRTLDPAVLILAPCDYRVDRTIEELSVLQNRTGWNELRAVRSEQVYVINGIRYVNCPSHTIGKTAAILQTAITGQNLTDFPPSVIRQVPSSQLEA